MSWLRYSLITALICGNVFANEKFTSKECLEAKLDTKIQHQGKFFGLLKNVLSISKDHCIVTVKFKNILDTEWLVDICREPIHMKVTNKGTQSVYKRAGECEAGDPTDFCAHYKELMDALQDHGLIFAKGERENLNTSHGQTYCSYLLLKQHLLKGILFSKYDSPGNIFEDDLTSKENCELPKVKESSTTSISPVKEQVITEPTEPTKTVDVQVESTADKLIEEAKF